MIKELCSVRTAGLEHCWHTHTESIKEEHGLYEPTECNDRCSNVTVVCYRICCWCGEKR